MMVHLQSEGGATIAWRWGTLLQGAIAKWTEAGAALSAAKRGTKSINVPTRA